jgi:hypothetical protein
MLIFGVIGLIAVIALVAYFMSGSEAIKDGKYATEDPRYYFIISKNRVQLWTDERQSGTFIKTLDFDIVNSGKNVPIDGKERVVYSSTTLIDRKTFYIAQSPSDVLYFYIERDGSLIQLQDKTFSNLRKVD